jgi:hypothetical protein
MFFRFIFCKFTIYSRNGAISKYVVRTHLCEVIIQWWFSYVYYALCCWVQVAIHLHHCVLLSLRAIVDWYRSYWPHASCFMVRLLSGFTLCKRAVCRSQSLGWGHTSAQSTSVVTHFVTSGNCGIPENMCWKETVSNCYGYRNELSSLARTLGSWVWIPLKTWVSVCVYSVFVLSCV